MQLAYYYQILIMSIAEGGTSDLFVYEGSIENINEVETPIQSNNVLIWTSSIGLSFVVLFLFLALLVTYLIRRERHRENYRSQVF